MQHPWLRDLNCRAPAEGSAHSMHDIQGFQGPLELFCKHLGVLCAAI